MSFNILCHDSIPFVSKRKITKQGYMRAPARLSRFGIYEYTADELGIEGEDGGKIYNVYRPESEVFSQESMDSFANLPVTSGHPQDLLNSTNTKNSIVGYSGDVIKRDSEFVMGTLTITDENVIKDINFGKKELSLGYEVICDRLGGTHNNVDYQFIQTKIIGNHISLVDKGRAGAKCAIMDSKIEDKKMGQPKKDDSKASKETVKDEVAITPTAKSPTMDEFKLLQDSNAKLVSTYDSLVERITSMEKSNAKIIKDAKAKEVLDAKAIDAQVCDKTDLIVAASKVITDGSIQAAMNARDILELGVKKINPEFKTEGKSNDYLRCMIDQAVIEIEKSESELAKASLNVATTDAITKPLTGQDALKLKGDDRV